MTQNQINFAKLREDQRHNLASERYNSLELEETKRHNVGSENINWYTATHNAEHYERQDDINWYSAETGRLEQGSKDIVNKAQAGYYTAQTGKVYTDQEIATRAQALAEKIAREGNWRDQQEVTTKEEANRIAEQNFFLNQSKFNHELIVWAEQWGIEKEKIEEEIAKIRSEKLKNVFSSTTSLADGIAKFMKSLLTGN